METNLAATLAEHRDVLKGLGKGEFVFSSEPTLNDDGTVRSFKMVVYRTGRAEFMVECAECGRPFVGKIERATFCGATCRSNAHRKAKRNQGASDV